MKGYRGPNDRYADKAPTFQGTGDLDVPEQATPPRRDRPRSQVMRMPAGRAKNGRLVPLDEIHPREIETILEWLCATTEERVERWAAPTEDDIAAKVGLPMATLVRFLQTPAAREVAHSAAQARALTALPDTIQGAIRDAALGDSRQRMTAREFIRRNATEQVQIVNQQNQIHSYDPTDDERLKQRLREVAVEVIHDVTAIDGEEGSEAG